MGLLAGREPDTVASHPSGGAAAAVASTALADDGLISDGEYAEQRERILGEL